ERNFRNHFTNRLQLGHGRAMRSKSTLIRSVLPFALATAGLVGCVADELDEGQQADEFDNTVQAPTTQVCNGGNFVCKSHLLIGGERRISPNATPSGLGPADLASAYKLNA